MEQGFSPDMIGRVVTFDEEDRMSEFSEQERNNEFELEQFVPQGDDDDNNNNEEPADHDVLEPEQFVPHDDDNGEAMDHDVLLEPEQFVPQDDDDDDDDNREPMDHDVLEPEDFVLQDDDVDENGEPMDRVVLAPEQFVPQGEAEDHDDNNAEPTDDDVLYGKGPNMYKRPGNTWYREDHLPQYQPRYILSTTKAGKRRVAQEALDALTGTMRRMLKRNGFGGWSVASSEENMKKIMCDIRHL
jgi:hypothetical protein